MGEEETTPEIVNVCPKERARDELRGYYYENDKRQDGDSAEYQPIIGEMRTINGRAVQVITYTLSAAPQANDFKHGVTQLYRVSNPEEIAAIERGFKEAEGFLNVKFERITAPGMRANINIFTATHIPIIAKTDTPPTTKDDKPLGIGGYSRTIGEDRFMVIKQGMFADVFTHELAHTLGLSHPNHAKERRDKKITDGQTGHCSDYNKDGSLLSYLPGYIRDAAVHFGPYDIFALQSMYGARKDVPSHFNITNLPSTVYSDKPAVLMVDDHYAAGGDKVADLRNYERGRIRMMPDLKTRIAFGTRFEGVDASASTYPLTLFAGIDKHYLVGGSGDDTLHAKEKPDRLIGGKGKDSFVIHNGQGHIIPDFEQGESISLEGAKSFKAEAAKNGTLLTGFDASGKTTHAVLLEKIRPEDFPVAALKDLPMKDVEVATAQPVTSVLQPTAPVAEKKR